MFSHLNARRTARAERGAVLVEAAIAIPLLIFLIFGGVELGMAWEARSAATSGVRTGLLRSASLGPRPEADLRTLQSIVGEIGTENVDDIGWIVIFNADTTDIDGRIAQCAATAGAAGGRGLDSLCSAYDTADLQAVAAGTLTISSFDTGGNGDDTSYTCDATKWDVRFCSGSRLIDGAINIGVAIEYNHQWTTGILPSDGMTYTEYSVSSTLTGDQAAAPGALGPPPGAAIPYNESFASGAGSSNATWSDSSVSSRNGVDYLGPLGNEYVSLTLDDLPEHDNICVTLDLNIIQSWDGNHSSWGPDSFSVQLESTTIFDETFSNVPSFEQSYEGTPKHISQLGYGDGTWGDSTYEITLCQPHTGSTARFDFGAYGLQHINDESWGISNVRVEVY